jgi:hypothetical protein
MIPTNDAAAMGAIASPLLAGSRLNLQVARFTSFSDLNAYPRALAAIPGVRDVKIRRFHKGALYLSVDYEGVLPLTERLGDVAGYPARHVSVAEDTIQVVLNNPDAD